MKISGFIHKKEKEGLEMEKIATNKNARFEYYIEDTFECGIVLKGTEVKSIRKGKININDSFATIENEEVFLKQAHISPYEQGNIYNVDPTRVRKLLLHKCEIRKLIGKLKVTGYSLIPTKVYFNNGKVKIEIALAKGKKLYDKRQDLAKKDANRRIERALIERTKKY